MHSDFNLSVEYFLEIADPYGKTKSEYSCVNFYYLLKDFLYDHEPDLQAAFISKHLDDRSLFIEAHVRHIKAVSGNYMGGHWQNAQLYLENKKLTLQQVFEDMFCDPPTKPGDFPFFLQYSFPEIEKLSDDNELEDIHQSFIFYISKYFVNKLIVFIQDLPNHGSKNKKQIIPKPVVNVKRSIPDSFTYLHYNSKLSNITDLLNSLIKNKFLHPDTDLKDFRKIFNNKKPTQPILWLNGIESLAYFVKCLHNENSFIEKIPHDIWKVTALLFMDKNKNSFDWKKLRGQKKPSRAKLIESAVSHLE